MYVKIVYPHEEAFDLIECREVSIVEGEFVKQGPDGGLEIDLGPTDVKLILTFNDDRKDTRVVKGEWEAGIYILNDQGKTIDRWSA